MCTVKIFKLHLVPLRHPVAHHEPLVGRGGGGGQGEVILAAGSLLPGPEILDTVVIRGVQQLADNRSLVRPLQLQ